MLVLRNGIVAAPGVSPETVRDQQAMNLGERMDGDTRLTDFHAGAGDRIQHPRRHDRDDAGRDLNGCEPAIAALLKSVQPQPLAGERMPAIMDNNILADMGRMAGRLPSDGATGHSVARTRAATAPPPSTR